MKCFVFFFSEYFWLAYKPLGRVVRVFCHCWAGLVSNMQRAFSPVEKPGCCHIAWASFWRTKVLQCSAGKLWVGSSIEEAKVIGLILKESGFVCALVSLKSFNGYVPGCWASGSGGLGSSTVKAGEQLPALVPQALSRVSSHWPSHEPGGSRAGQGEETWVLVMTNVISGKSVNLSAHQCFHLCKGALGLMIPNFPSSLGAPTNEIDWISKGAQPWLLAHQILSFGQVVFNLGCT